MADISLPKNSKLGMLLSLIVGVVFTSLGLMISQGILKRGDCEYLCIFGKCFIAMRTCTSQELFFWQTGFLIVGILCLLLAGVTYLRSLIK